ncbi:zinc finger and BTB domain-containing protein 43-like [Megalops cyprinoides]|uniref:zinc finger and BTB domain-containing protein 43-like n=1 Tax=Megalops cyprinoides TaxID=118141 RepID=UPI0018653C90|nr:zinc finger and BTB domain-containing protein 43-like [Megalops cyprinoides]
MEAEANSLRVEFPDFSCSILEKLNRQRQLGQLCDITVVIQGHRFRAHRAVLAASSPYFCDQVLLKNSMRVVLPDVMHPCVFESLLQSCYTGVLQLPVGEIVGFLTAASFLQMWHVVDKCTELLEANSAILGQRSGPGSVQLSPGGGSGYDSPSEAFDPGQQALFGRISDCADGEVERLVENCFSPQDAAARGSSPPERDRDGEDGGGDAAERQPSRPLYIQPSIMCHKRWIQVKAERVEQEDRDGPMVAAVAGEEEEAAEDPNSAEPEPASYAEDEYQLTPGTSSLGAGAEEKLAADLEEIQEGEHPYDDPLDFYGASMEEFSGDKAEGGPGEPKEDAGGAAGADGEEPPEGIQEETSHSGFAAVVYKLYPCQCGKSFTHKSQRDRHMSMHMGLRPYGCAVCGKKFKMKHHLVGHMKIHTGVKPYECSVCGKRFMWRDSFNRHVSSCTRSHQARRAVAEQAAQIC